MAEKEKAGQDKPVSEDELRNGEVKENGLTKSPEKQVNDSVEEEQEAGAGKREGEAAQQNGHKPEGQDSAEEAEEDGDAAEGSMFVAPGSGHRSLDFSSTWLSLKVEDAQHARASLVSLSRSRSLCVQQPHKKIVL